MHHDIQRIHKRRKGLTLIEAAATLSLIAVVVSGALLGYNITNESRMYNSAMSDLLLLQEEIRNIYHGRSNYSGLDPADLITRVPKRMIVNSTSLVNAFGYAIDIYPVDDAATTNGTARGFAISYASVPSRSCIKFATTDFGRAANRLVIGSNSDTSVPKDATTANTECANDPSMTWTFDLPSE